MALRTWVNTLGDVYARAAATDPGNRTDLLRKGISRAVERGRRLACDQRACSTDPDHFIVEER